MEKLALLVSGTIFIIVSIMHLLRLIFNLTIKIGNFTVPLKFSLFGCLISLLLSMWMFMLLMR